MGLIENSSLADLAIISEKIRVLESRVDALYNKIPRSEIGGKPHPDIGESGPPPSLDLMETGEGLGEWVSKGALLQNMAILCFILVFALLLRTVTDYGYVNATAGSFLGLAYVSILAAIGCIFYMNGKKTANVFSISGFILLFTIVFEGYGRFGTISLGVAYGILCTALLTSAVVGIKYRATKLLAVSLIGVTISSLIIGFPRVHFPLSGVLFFVANWLAVIAAERLGNSKLKWPVTFFTFIFLAVWVFKAYVPIARGGLVPEYIYINWLPPFLVGFVALYFMTYVRRYFSKIDLTLYDAVIPSLNMLLLLLAGSVVAKDYWQLPWFLGLVALVMGVTHFTVGWRLSQKDSGRFIGVGGAFVAGSIALALGAILVVDNIAWAISFWSLLAYGLARLSGRCDSGVLRIMSYLHQIFAVLIGLALGVFEVGKSAPFHASLVAALALALFGLMQFRWCRGNPPPSESLLAKLDTRDYSAIALLVVGLSGLYLLAKMAIDLLAPMLLTDPANTIMCGRSIIINLAVTILLILGGRRRDLELVWIAVFLAIVGCLKVFLVDLFSTSGIPLVLSVLSFGVVAMVGSIVMGRWPRKKEV